MAPSHEQRYVGCMLGVAVGDALGQPIEAFPPERLVAEFGEIRDFLPGDPRLPLPLGPGQWTDDTQMTLDILRSVIRCRAVDPADIAREFVLDHEQQGIRFSGFTVTYSLKRLRRGVPWDRSGLTDEKSAGNGAAMRIAPVGLLDCRRLDRLHEDVRLASVITHRHPEAVKGAEAVAYLVARGAAGSLSPATAVDEAIAFVGDCRVSENLSQVGAVLKDGVEVDEALRRLGTSGYVVHTVAAAVYCFVRTPFDFERSLINAVMGGNDADTTAAVTGAISGAFNGEHAIPERWRNEVERGPEIKALALQLCSIVE